MPICFGDEGWGSLGTLKSWGDTAYWLVTKIYTGPAGQSAGIFGLWPSLPSSVFYVNRTSNGLEFGTNAWAAFSEITKQLPCILFSVTSYNIGAMIVPADTWITLVIGAIFNPVSDPVQIENPTPLGGYHQSDADAWWMDGYQESGVNGAVTQTCENLVRKASGIPPCIYTQNQLNNMRIISVRKPPGTTDFTIGQTSAGGTKFEGALLEISLWSGTHSNAFVPDDFVGFRRTPGYALNPTADNDGRPELQVYWPLIDDGATDYQGAEQTSDLTAIANGTGSIGDCYDWDAERGGAYDPMPLPERKKKGGQIVTPHRTTKIITPDRSAEVEV